MTNRMTLLLAMAVLLAASVFLGWRRQVIAAAPPPYKLAAVWDASIRIADRCAMLPEAVEAALQGKRIAKGSEFTLIRTGNRAGGFYPARVFTLPIPRMNSGPLGGAQGLERDQFRHSIARACSEIPASERSPIFAAMELALAYLEPSCKSPEHCGVLLVSDLLENQHAAVKEQMDARRATARPLIKNASIAAVTVYGYAETDEDGAQRRDLAQVVEVWRGLFDGPVTFHPLLGSRPQMAER